MINFYPNEPDPEIEALRDSGASEEEVKKLQNYLKNPEDKTKESKNKPNYQKKPDTEKRIAKSRDAQNANAYQKWNLKDAIEFGLDQYYNPDQMPTHSKDAVWHHNGEERKSPKNFKNLEVIEGSAKIQI